MKLFNINEAESCVLQSEEKFNLIVNPDPLTKLQLLLIFNSVKGMELFGVGAWEIRFPFMYYYGKLINNALGNGYRVFLKKKGRLFKDAEWFLEFLKVE